MSNTSRSVVFLFLAFYCLGCQSDGERLLNSYFETIHSTDFKSFEAILHPKIRETYNLNERDFIRQLTDDSTITKLEYGDLEILDEFTGSTTGGDDYIIIAYRTREKREFAKSSAMRAFYIGLQQGYVGQEVDQQTIEIGDNGRSISFINLSFSMLLKSQGSSDYSIVPKCLRRVFNKLFGEEEAGIIFDNYALRYQELVKPDL